MNYTQLAQGAYAKFKVKAIGEDFTAAGQVHAFVYNRKGQILKQFAKNNQSGYSSLELVDGDAAAIYIEIFPNDTKNCKPEKYYVDLQKYITVGESTQPLHNPSFSDDNVLFELKASVASDKSPS